MATFTGTGAAETITPDSVSPTVIVNPPGVRPGGGADAINAGGGNDIVAGGGGNDVVGLGDGDDRFFWLPGHGADAVDGGTGDDTFEFNGVTGTDTIEVFRTGAVAKVSDVGPAVTLTGIETIKVFALGGEDAVFVRDLGGTGVEGVVVDLGLTAGAPGDGLMDEVYVQGTSAADTLIVTASGGVVRVDGMAADLSIVGIDGATDTVRLVGGLGDDRLDASAMSRKAMSVGIEGDEGNDTLIGGKGNDWLLGEDGDDVIRGGNGKDSLDGGAGVDLLKGGKGKDTFEFSTELIGSGRDRIKDFELGVDTIAIETGPGALGDKLYKDEFRIGVKAKDGDDFILYDDDSGVLRWDADGKGGNDAVAFARIGKHLDLTHKDFDVLLG